MYIGKIEWVKTEEALPTIEEKFFDADVAYDILIFKSGTYYGYEIAEFVIHKPSGRKVFRVRDWDSDTCDFIEFDVSEVPCWALIPKPPKEYIGEKQEVAFID